MDEDATTFGASIAIAGVDKNACSFCNTGWRQYGGWWGILQYRLVYEPRKI